MSFTSLSKDDKSFKLERVGQLCSNSTTNSPPRYFFEGKGVKEAGKELCAFIDPNHILDSPRGPRHPLIIFAFDEAHVLTSPSGVVSWNLFIELRRILRATHEDPIFSLFLTTTGRFQLFSPAISSDPSSRVINNDLGVLHPVSEISFDTLAYSAKENTVSLHRVTQIDWIARLGRPLCVNLLYSSKSKPFTNSSRFGAYYIAMQDEIKLPQFAMHYETELLQFAKQKLLNGPSTLDSRNSSASLACLCVRFGLEFNADAISREVACTQVERHMRLCLAATTGFERLVTITGSEPLLAEAASQLMGGNLKNPVHHLAKHLDLDCIDRGRRGELVAALIIMQARDEASEMERSRWISVSGFMKALLPEASFEDLHNSLPTFCRAEEDKPFGEMFEDYAMWFNHVIRVMDPKAINAQHLWTFITRGAMVVCTDNQYGVDLVIPLCLKTGNLSRMTVSAILIQVKNAKRYGTTIDKTLFDGMDPVAVGLFDKGSPKRPVIRIVFALAPEEGGISFPAKHERQSARIQGDKFTTFDIWCAGLTEHTFRGIGDDLTPYKVLLDRLLQYDQVFKLQEINDELLDKETKALRESLRRKMSALTIVDDHHHQLHV